MNVDNDDTFEEMKIFDLDSCFALAYLFMFVTYCRATKDPQEEVVETVKNHEKPVLLPDLNQPLLEQSNSESDRDSSQNLLSDGIGNNRERKQKELKRMQRIRYKLKLNKDPVRKAALNARRKSTNKKCRAQRMQRFTPEQRRAFLDRVNFKNRQTWANRKETKYGGFSSRKEQERSRLRTLERLGTASSMDLEKLASFRLRDRINYHRREDKKKKRISDLAATLNSSWGEKKTRNSRTQNSS